MNITVAGLGYVGLSNAVLLAQKYNVMGFDINEEKIQSIKNGVSPIEDKEISQFLSEGKLSLSVTTDKKEAYTQADYIIIATPTNYDEKSGAFDTSSIEKVLDDALALNDTAVYILRSTVPMGYTQGLILKYNYKKIIFVPEFLREGNALNDSLYPSRVVIGCDQSQDDVSGYAQVFSQMLTACVKKDDVDILIMEATEAEAVKLFANTYLAMRVAYFNELDTYAEKSGLDALDIIRGVCLDPRIGDYYNNPSFGYGGYCFPKDTKQLLANYSNVPNELISAIVTANRTRKDHITEQVINMNPKRVGIYKLAMKSGSDNFRNSSVLGIMKRLTKKNIPMLVYEPSCTDLAINHVPIENNLQKFKELCDIIITNRYDNQLDDVRDKVYTRDLFTKD